MKTLSKADRDKLIAINKKWRARGIGLMLICRGCGFFLNKKKSEYTCAYCKKKWQVK